MVSFNMILVYAIIFTGYFAFRLGLMAARVLARRMSVKEFFTGNK